MGNCLYSNDDIDRLVNSNDHHEIDPPEHSIYSSLQDSMDRTHEIMPTAQLPLILTSLCTKLRDLNGFDTPCIFRVDIEKQQLKEEKAKLLENDYSSNYSDPHIAACLLKDWIRNLKQPIIPQTHYDRAIKMAKDDKLNPGILNQQTLQQFISELPTLNRETIKYLIKFLQDLTREEHVENNKMNIGNIALMFGTIIFKCPSSEPTIIISHASYQSAFTRALIKYW